MRSSLENGLRDGFSLIAEFLPKLVLFLIILVVGLFVAKAEGHEDIEVLARMVSEAEHAPEPLAGPSALRGTKRRCRGSPRPT